MRVLILCMKKLMFSVILAAFAVTALADDAKTTTTKASKEQASCCSAKATQTKATTKAGDKMACSGCCKDAAVKQALLSPKDAASRGL
ncbi:MAG TPA: hypothetical protein VLT36_03990 [Candidatus Dormibacteraeota bacterium]|nr:hypothetical protein [Candidatus Dormibacteraeota bacterium]